MKRSIPTRAVISSFAVAVTASALALGLTCATACTESGGYYVIYSTPDGYLARTETQVNDKKALYTFEKDAMHAVLFNH